MRPSHLPSRPPLAVLFCALLSLALSIGFFAYLSPGRLEHWGDQKHYEAMGEILASTGTFLSSRDDPRPETYRTVGYPLFLALIIKMFGAAYPGTALIQALLVASLPVLIFLIARDHMSHRLAVGASAATALYPPLSFWTAYTMSEALGFVAVTVGAVGLYLALRQRSIVVGFLAGACLGYGGLVRPTLAFIGPALCIAIFIAGRALRLHGVPTRVLAVIAATALAVGVAPSVAHTAINYGRLSLVPARPGVQLLFGYWQGIWPGRESVRLNDLAATHASEEAVRAFAAERGLDVALASRYVADIRTYVDWPVADPVGPFIAVNDWALDEAVSEIGRDLPGFVARGFKWRLPVLLVGSIPLRYEQIDSVPRAALILIWGVQALALGLALVGVGVLLVRRGSAAIAGTIIAGVLAYISVIHFALATDPRYGLVTWPLLLASAVVGGSFAVGTLRSLIRRRTSSRVT